MITEYPFPISETDVSTLFNEETNDLYIYHGTCQIYHEGICKNGFAGCYSIFTNHELESLVKLLATLGMTDGDHNNRSVKYRIQKYIYENKSPSLSFTFSAYEAFYYASELRKGGQIFMAIQDALNWIQQGNFELDEIGNKIIQELNRRIKQITISKGSVYCISVDKEVLNNLQHIDAMNDVSNRFDAAKYTGLNIPVENIRGVIHLDSDYIPNYTLIKKISDQIKANSTNKSASLVFQLKRKKFK